MKLFAHTFGCRVNQVETESVRERLAEHGAVTVEDWREAEVCVVNTCTVTEAADKDALRLVRRIGRENPGARLFVTGCLATRAPGLLREAAPHAVLVGNAEKEILPALVGCRTAPEGYAVREFAGKDRAFVKVQDGCNMSCTYCIVPTVRPNLSSKPWSVLQGELRGLLGAGYKELVLCGVRLGRYLDDGARTPERSEGEDAAPAARGSGERRVDFVELLRRTLSLPGDFRVRLSSFEVTDVTARFLALYEEFPGRLCPYLHVPLQSGSDRVLKAMERWYSASFYRRRIEALREALPDAALFSDVMTAFPGETEAEHQESLRFIEELGFSGLHPFRFSAREGTAAAALEPLPEEVVERRSLELRALDRALRARFAARERGRLRTVLVEEGGRGYTETFLKVRLTEPRPAGSLVPVRVLGERGGRVEAEPL